MVVAGGVVTGVAFAAGASAAGAFSAGEGSGGEPLAGALGWGAEDPWVVLPGAINEPPCRN